MSSKSIPQLGLGTWKAPPGVVAEVVEQAIATGYTAIDCACDYGNEIEVGAGIAAGLKASSKSREDIFITSKLWNTYHRAEHVEPAFRKTLTDLGLDYLDMYLIHFPISLKYVPFDKRYPPEWIHDPESDPTVRLEYVSIAETWKAMEALVDQGLVRQIGISNFPVALIMDLLSVARIKPSVLQVELHPYLQQTKLISFCQTEGIAVTAYSPFGASSYKELGMDCGDNLLEEDVLKRIAKERGKTVAQVCLRWAIQRGTSVIPKTSKVNRLAENSDVFDWALEEEDMASIAKMERGRRYNDPGVYGAVMGRSMPIYD